MRLAMLHPVERVPGSIGGAADRLQQDRTMPTSPQLLASLLTAAVLTAAPGPDNLIVPSTKGLVANANNPKVLLFFLSVLPQFVNGSHGKRGGTCASAWSHRADHGNA